MGSGKGGRKRRGKNKFFERLFFFSFRIFDIFFVNVFIRGEIFLFYGVIFYVLIN